MPEVDLQIAAAHAQTIAKSQRKEARAYGPAPRPERRRDRRNKAPRQVWIQAMDANGKLIEEVQVMRDYSRGGFYFVSSLHCYCVGMRVHVIPAFGSLNLEFVAEIVRVEPKAKTAYGIGVKLLHARDPIAPQQPSKA
jgi:PilZ domain